MLHAENMEFSYVLSKREIVLRSIIFKKGHNIF